MKEKKLSRDFKYPPVISFITDVVNLPRYLHTSLSRKPAANLAFIPDFRLIRIRCIGNILLNETKCFNPFPNDKF